MALSGAQVTRLSIYGGIGGQWGDFSGKEALVEVPDVVGGTEAAGTTTLEGDGFVVAVETAYSSSVAVGLIISQDPTAGSFASSGSTVTITVSLGPDEQPVGGWAFLYTYEDELRRRRDEERRRQELKEETEQIADTVDREIAQFMRAQEAIDAEREQAERLKQLAKQSADLEAARQYSERVAKALQRALATESVKALQRLETELRKAREEEEALLMAMLLFSE